MEKMNLVNVYPRLTRSGLESASARRFSEDFAIGREKWRAQRTIEDPRKCRVFHENTLDHLIDPVICSRLYKLFSVALSSEPWNNPVIKQHVMERAKFEWLKVKLGSQFPYQEAVSVAKWAKHSHKYQTQNPSYFKETFEEAKERVLRHYEKKIADQQAKRSLLLTRLKEFKLPTDPKGLSYREIDLLIDKYARKEGARQALLAGLFLIVPLMSCLFLSIKWSLEGQNK